MKTETLQAMIDVESNLQSKAEAYIELTALTEQIIYLQRLVEEYQEKHPLYFFSEARRRHLERIGELRAENVTLTAENTELRQLLDHADLDNKDYEKVNEALTDRIAKLEKLQLHDSAHYQALLTIAKKYGYKGIIDSIPPSNYINKRLAETERLLRGMNQPTIVEHSAGGPTECIICHKQYYIEPDYELPTGDLCTNPACAAVQTRELLEDKPCDQ